LNLHEPPSPTPGLSFRTPGAQQLPEHQALVAVVETGSFSEAARLLGVTKSCVSKQVGRLEERLGVRLLQRTTRRIHLTEVGERFYRSCVHILDAIQSAEVLAAEMHTSPRGTLRLASPVMFGQRFVGPAVCEFLRQHPQVNADLIYRDDAVDLVGEGMDLCIQVGELPDSSLLARRLMTSRNLVCASPAYLDRRGVPHTVAELEGHVCLVSSPTSTACEWRFHNSESEQVIKLEARVNCNHLSGVLATTLSGLGLAMLPDYAVEEHLASGELVAVLGAWTRHETPVWLLYPHSDVSAKTRSFIDFLVDRIELEL